MYHIHPNLPNIKLCEIKTLNIQSDYFPFILCSSFLFFAHNSLRLLQLIYITFSPYPVGSIMQLLVISNEYVESLKMY